LGLYHANTDSPGEKDAQKFIRGISRGIAAILFMFLILILLDRAQIATSAPTYEETFYTAPIVTVVNYENLIDMKNRLGTGGYYAKIGFSASTFYMNETKGKSQDFEFEPSGLNNTLNLSKLTNTPVVVFLNGGPWGNANLDPEFNLIVHLEQDPMNAQWRSDNTVPSDDEYQLGVGRILTYNNLNETVRFYKERNFRGATAVIAQFYKERPDLLIGVNTDPEIFMSPYYYSDYNPQTIIEFRENEKSKFRGDINAFNLAMGTFYKDWDELSPPRTIESVAGNPLGEEWTNFRIALIDGLVQREVDWLREAGLPASRIYTHQTVRTDNLEVSRYVLASPLETASVNGGSIGITTLQDLSFDENLFATARSWSPNWGIFEYNPSLPHHDLKSAGYSWGDHYFRTLRGLQVAYKYGAHILSPYMWEEPYWESFYTVRGTAFETAIRDFMRQAGTDVERIWGADSLQTAAAIAQSAWPSSKVALLVRDDHFSDALSGVSLASTFKDDPKVNTPVPLLLTNSNHLSLESLKEMKRLGTETAIILGGPGAISKNVANQLRANGITPDRISQESAYGTAADIARRMRINANNFGVSPPDTAVIATGENFQDALAISSPAAANNMPVILVRPKSIPRETLELLDEGWIKKIIIAGGPGAVHPDVEQELRNRGYEILARLWGNDQYETAVSIANQGQSLFHFTSPGAVFITRGDHYVDGLVGGALASRMNPAPILLVEPNKLPPATRSYIFDTKPQISRLYILGGSAAISPSISEQFENL